MSIPMDEPVFDPGPDPVLGPDGEVAARWECPDCPTAVHQHPDPEHPSHDWTRDYVREHRYVHHTQLHDLHHGDRAMLRLALRYPHLHTGIITVHGPIAGLHPDRRAEILRAAGIEDQ